MNPLSDITIEDALAVGYLGGLGSGVILTIAYTYIVWRCATIWHGWKARGIRS